MESVVSESTMDMLTGKDLGYNLNESGFQLREIAPIDSQDFIKYIVEKSPNIRHLTDLFEYDLSTKNIKLQENGKFVDIYDKSDNSILRVRLEHFVRSDVENYLSKLDD